MSSFTLHTPRTATRNFHVHMLATMREIGPDGFGKKVREWNHKAEFLNSGWNDGPSWARNTWNVRASNRKLTGSEMAIFPAANGRVGPISEGT